MVERFRRKKISMVGDGDGRHFPARRFVDDFFEVAGAIQQAVIRVQMQVNESGSFHAGGYSNLARRFLLCSDLGAQALLPVRVLQSYFSLVAGSCSPQNRTAKSGCATHFFFNFVFGFGAGDDFPGAMR
jgi:hypothetical protein